MDDGSFDEAVRSGYYYLLLRYFVHWQEQRKGTGVSDILRLGWAGGKTETYGRMTDVLPSVIS